ncbi:MAG TPA: hypothetical protein VLI90_12225 [Tepidisphaeraceae bacterium]|nr:hypothetical protein [Tepidisphaeraceae bacterium]
MNASLRRFDVSIVERLESRRLLSVAISTAATAGAAAGGDVSAAPSTVVLTGTALHAQTNQFFRAVVATIRNLPLLSSVYRFRASINWGDGKASSFANFVRQADGSIAVIGAHTYASVGVDDITVMITAVPPAWSALPVRIVGTFKSSATVFAPDGGVTIEATAGVHVTATVGFFRTTLSSTLLGATIDWGDGQQSAGKILALPTADPLAGGAFAVVGEHTYSAVASDLVHVTVYELTPVGAAPPTTIIAEIDSVVDVLPISPVAALLPGDANGDGVVDVADLGAIASNYGDAGGATWDMGDFNGDGAVDVGDLGALASSYGNVASYADPAAATSAATDSSSTSSASAVVIHSPTATVASLIDGLFSVVAIA